MGKEKLLNCALLVTMAMTAPIQAAELYWPRFHEITPTSPCANLTLNECINSVAVDGDTIVIDEDSYLDFLSSQRVVIKAHEIDYNVQINKPLTLTVKNGVDAIFQNGRSINVVLSGADSANVTIENLTFRRGQILVRDNRSASTGGNITVQRIRFLDVPSFSTTGQGYCAIDMQGNVSGLGASNFYVYGNTMFAGPASDGEAAVCIRGSSVFSVAVSGNRVEAPDGGLRDGIVLFVGNQVHDVRISRNRITGNTSGIGRGLDSGIKVSQAVGMGSLGVFTVDNNSVVGHTGYSVPGAGIEMDISNANVFIEHNSVAHGDYGLALSSDSLSGQTFTANVRNNLVAHHAAFGFYFDMATAGGMFNLVDARNLEYQNVRNMWSPTGTVIQGDPKLSSKDFPKPRAGGAGVDQGIDAGTGLSIGLDVLGERRDVFTPDIGAYELSEDRAARVVRGTGNSTGLNEVAIEEFGPLGSNDIIVATSVRTQAPTLEELRQELGVYYSNPWRIFYQNNTVAMSAGRTFHALLARDSKPAFTHTVDTTANFSVLNYSSLNGRTDAVAVATHQYINAYYPQPLGLEYSGAGWYLNSQTNPPTAIPAGTRFNVIVAPTVPVGEPENSGNGFRVALGSAPDSELRLEHPLLDNNLCAAPVAWRVDTPEDGRQIFNAKPYSLEYRASTVAGMPGHWFIVLNQFSTSATEQFPAYAAFNVIVDGNQAAECLAKGLLFSDGFENP